MADIEEVEGIAAGRYGECTITIGDRGRLILTGPTEMLFSKPMAVLMKAADFRVQANGEVWQSRVNGLLEDGKTHGRLPRNEATLRAIHRVLDKLDPARAAQGTVPQYDLSGVHGDLTVTRLPYAWRVTHADRYNESVHRSLTRLGADWKNGGWQVPVMVNDKLAKFLPRHVKAAAEERVVRARQAEADAHARAAAQARAAEAQALAAAELAARRAAMPPIESGYHGRFHVSPKTDGSSYTIWFPYDAEDVAAIKEIGGSGFDNRMKTWQLDRLHTDKLRPLLDAAVVRAQRERVLDEERRKSEAEAAMREWQERNDADRAAGIRRGSHFEGDHGSVRGVPVVGELREFEGVVHRLQTIGQGRYCREDAMSFGGNDDSGTFYDLTWKVAEEADVAIYRGRQVAVAERRTVIETMRRLADAVSTRENYDAASAGGLPDGERLLDTINIYGSGECWIIGEADIWLQVANGMDGDDWSRNNMYGFIGYRVPFSQDLADQLRAADALLSERPAQERAAVPGDVPTPSDEQAAPEVIEETRTRTSEQRQLGRGRVVPG